MDRRPARGPGEQRRLPGEGTEGSGHTDPGVVSKDLQFLARGDLPKADGFVATPRGKQPAVGREGECADPHPVSREAPHFLAGTQVPELDRVTRSGDSLAVGREGRAKQVALQFLKNP